MSPVPNHGREKVVDVARGIGINRGTVTRLYHETASRVELEVVAELCRYFDCQVGELFEYIEERPAEGGNQADGELGRHDLYV